MVFQTHASSYCISSFPCLCFLSVCQFPLSSGLILFSLPTLLICHLFSLLPYPQEWQSGVSSCFQSSPHITFCLLDQTFFQHWFWLSFPSPADMSSSGYWLLPGYPVMLWGTEPCSAMSAIPCYSIFFLSFFLYENVMPSLNLLINHCGGSFPQHLQCSVLY